MEIKSLILFPFTDHKTTSGKVCNCVSLYRSPKQSLEDFETFADNFELYLGHNYKKTIDLETNFQKHIWKLKLFLNIKKILCTPPLFHKNEFTVNFRDKVELFNNFFVKRCTQFDNASEISVILYIKTTKKLQSHQRWYCLNNKKPSSK